MPEFQPALDFIQQFAPTLQPGFEKQRIISVHPLEHDAFFKMPLQVQRPLTALAKSLFGQSRGECTTHRCIHDVVSSRYIHVMFVSSYGEKELDLLSKCDKILANNGVQSEFRMYIGQDTKRGDTLFGWNYHRSNRGLLVFVEPATDDRQFIYWLLDQRVRNDVVGNFAEMVTRVSTRSGGEDIIDFTVCLQFATAQMLYDKPITRSFEPRVVEGLVRAAKEYGTPITVFHPDDEMLMKKMQMEKMPTEKIPVATEYIWIILFISLVCNILTVGMLWQVLSALGSLSKTCPQL